MVGSAARKGALGWEMDGRREKMACMHACVQVRRLLLLVFAFFYFAGGVAALGGRSMVTQRNASGFWRGRSAERAALAG